LADKRGLLTGKRISRVQEFAVEALMVLDMNRDARQRSDAMKARAEDFWHEFNAKIAAQAKEPWKALASYLPELGISFESDEQGEYPDEDKLPPPEEDDIQDLEAWLAQHSGGTVSGDEL
jgi:hypothetical protein